MDNLGFYAIGFFLGGYIKSAITGCSVTDTLWIQTTDKDRKPTGSKIRLPFIPELLGAATIGGFLHYLSL